MPAHGDVSDWFDAGHDGRELMELARDAAPWTPPATPAPAVATLPPAQPTGAPTRLYYEDTPSFTDTGNSTRLIALHGARLRHVHAWATWLVWSGTVWAHDPKAALLDELTKDVGLALKREAAACADDSTAKVLFAWGQKWLAAGKTMSQYCMLSVIAISMPRSTCLPRTSRNSTRMAGSWAWGTAWWTCARARSARRTRRI